MNEYIPHKCISNKFTVDPESYKYTKKTIGVVSLETFYCEVCKANIDHFIIDNTKICKECFNELLLKDSEIN
jgi:hypothetical protein